MCDCKHHSNSGGFLNGLVMGALMGAGFVLFMSGKKGRELTNELVGKGLDIFDDFDGFLDELYEDAPREADHAPVPMAEIKPVVEQKPVAETPTRTHESLSYHNQPFISDMFKSEEPAAEEYQEYNETPQPVYPIQIQSVSSARERFVQEQPVGLSHHEEEKPQQTTVSVPLAGERSRRFFHGIPKRR